MSDETQPVPLEIRWLRLKTKDPEEIVTDLLRRVALLEEDADTEREKWDREARGYQARIEGLESRGSGLGRFEAAIQEAHSQAHHLGDWALCPNAVCRSLERFLHTEAKDGAR